MKPQEIRELSEKEREEKVADLSQESFNLKFQLATGKIENPSRVRSIRRDIARIKTIQHELTGQAAAIESASESKTETAEAKE
ncbi:MAG: 50S ribosomal protein L29 [Candidatus Nitrohelix vancouverensis]|uniref:Large ribosomal subunit protein uL29 n=1 Tax=Candidatus Nitrohelix vancouverensis TaxID=2705534 RepID=A0A7T0C0F7_9BACT|nr:MAG: 50S ribosomal protein L29 [Candidatus Nitrohelix vancouverensis]